MTIERAIELSGLSAEELKQIETLLKRKPTLEEIGMFGALWSEHCGYKNTKALIKKLPTKGKHLIQGPGENAGIVGAGDYEVVFKIESHNHPSAVEPYQGAATGVGGILRDIFAMGAQPIAVLDSLRFGKKDSKRTRYLVGGVISGIADYGNRVGIPTVAGELVFEDGYEGNPLVNVMCVGIAKKGKTIKATASGKGNLLFYYGSRTGRDGLGGATFASAELSSEGEDKRPSVQVGDAFREKLILEATLEIVEKQLAVGVQDMGAAGITSSSCEMASRGRSSIELNMDKVPAREEKMIPYEFLLSESQERMLACVEPKMLGAMIEVMNKWELDYAIIGSVIDEPNDDPKVIVKENGKVLADIPIKYLVDDVPIYVRELIRPAYLDEVVKIPQYCPEPDHTRTLQKLLSHPNIASKEWVYERYDHHVQTNLLAEPVMAGGAMLRLKGSKVGLGVATDGNGRYTYLDPYTGGMQAVAEVCRNLSAMGATPYGITNCLNFGSPLKSLSYYQMVKAVEGMAEACRVLEAPITGGNASLYNETDGEPIPPTIVVGSVGVIDDYEKTVFADYKQSGHLIGLLGANKDEIGGSLYIELMTNKMAGKCPELNIQTELKLHTTIRKLIDEKLVASSQDVSDGGIAVTIAEGSILSGKLGARVDMKDAIPAESMLFGETQSRIVISFDASKLTRIEKICAEYDTSFAVVGKVTENDRVEIAQNGKTLIDAKVKDAIGWYNTRY